MVLAVAGQWRLASENLFSASIAGQFSSQRQQQQRRPEGRRYCGC
ncbi:hypothetical protein [Ferrimonas senticii]|nr:hypothetical protein [Ferrimonas senticii]